MRETDACSLLSGLRVRSGVLLWQVRLTGVAVRFALPMWQSGVRLTDVAVRFALSMWQSGSPYRCGSPAVRLTDVSGRFALSMCQAGSPYQCGRPVRLINVAGRFVLPMWQAGSQSGSPYRCGNPVADFFSHSQHSVQTLLRCPRSLRVQSHALTSVCTYVQNPKHWRSYHYLSSETCSTQELNP